MDTKSQGNSPNDNLLVSWKDIAAYLKCSVRKAQRLEPRELPVKRIAGTKSVWASKSEIDRWLTSQAEKTKGFQTQFATISAAKNVSFEQTDEPSSTAWPFAITLSRSRLWLLGILLGLTIGAAVISAYALTIVFFGTTAAFVLLTYPSLPDTGYMRVMVGLFIVAGMSYCARATTLPDVVGSILNMTTLKPAVAYPFVTGLRFIPIPVLTIAMLAVFSFRHSTDFAEHPRFHKAYLILGVLCLFVTAIAELIASGADRIWQSGLPIRWTLLAGEAFVFGVNITLLAFGYLFFNTTSTKRFHQLLSWYGIGYLLIALTAAIVNRHWNEIDKYYLDVRRPYAYRALSANAGNDFKNWLMDHIGEAGPDLMSLSNDAEFLHALQTQKFYKQDFDEPFQVSGKAVIFGYKSFRDSQHQQPIFVRIRFPASLVAALRFER